MQKVVEITLVGHISTRSNLVGIGAAFRVSKGFRNDEAPACPDTASVITPSDNLGDSDLTSGEPPSRLAIPFTGERVIPGLVEPQLWNEHLSRYRFASLFAKGKRVLDAGCGTGYGTDLLARAARLAIGFDTSREAIGYAQESFWRADYVCGSASVFPFQGQSVDLVTAFEVIEHLHDWEALVEESARVLTHQGVFLVSTPNTEYYAEARGASGPNPFHVHEFQLAEFDAALKRVFPYVQILAQNQQEAITFSGESCHVERQVRKAAAFLPPTKNLADAHFFLAVCSFEPLKVPYFADVASTHNLLRERETHIRGLQGELASARHEYSVLIGLCDSLRDEVAIQANAVHSLGAELQELQREQEQIRRSAWIRLGRALGIGPWSDYRARIRIRVQRGRAVLTASRQQIQDGCSLVRRRLQAFGNYVQAVALYLAGPLLLLGVALYLGVVDIAFAVAGRKRAVDANMPDNRAASIVIPSWNGLALLKANLPALFAAVQDVSPVEIIVVDNGSVDGTADYVRTHFPQIRLLALPVNRGFAAACNEAARLAKHDVVVFLNNDMRPEKGFLSALLKGFGDAHVFAVSSQIFFADPTKLREETGLTEVWWEKGQLAVGHRIDPLVQDTYPCAYPGGGSSAFDRAKFLEVGGFDELFQPFYYEDTDLGFGAWKRGWKVLYEPRSVVHHDHRGTIGKSFSAAYIDATVRVNAMLYCWKNIHGWRRLLGHFGSCAVSSLSVAPGRPPARPCSAADIRSAFGRLLQAGASRWRAHELQQISDREAFQRPLGGYYRDRFLFRKPAQRTRLNVLLVSPYPIEPPTHGGAVFMREAVHALASVADVHVVSFVDIQEQLQAQQALLSQCRSAMFLVRPHVCLDDQWTFMPNAIREFAIRDFAWAVHRTILQKEIDVLQLEYTTMGQYAGEYRNIPCMLFEHDISAQSLWRRIKSGDHNGDLILEYLRMRMYEPRMLKRVTRVQVCSDENARFLNRLVPKLHGRVDFDVRAGINVWNYDHPDAAREPDSLLFIGSFRHLPNVDALKWFIREVMPIIHVKRPNVVLNVVGSDCPTDSNEWSSQPGVRLLGSVPDVKVPLQRFSVFICPVLSGSGVRVKLLEAFASGIPAVATSIGAEGLHSPEGSICEVADTAIEFARATLRLLTDEDHRRILAHRARRFVEDERDSRKATARLEALYRREVARMRGSLESSPSELQTA